jgi:hypothetical protein
MRPVDRRLGSDEPCPHCGTRSGVLPDAPTGHRCAMCGGPRVVVEPAVDRPRGEKTLLMQARATRMRRAAWGVGAGVATAFAAFAALVTLVLAGFFDLGALGWTALSVLTLLPAFIAGFGWKRVAGLSNEAREQVRAAEEQVAAELLEASNGRLQAGDLARIMHVSEERAIDLLAHGEVAGVLSESLGAAPAARLRVAEGEPLEAGRDTREPGRARR